MAFCDENRLITGDVTAGVDFVASVRTPAYPAPAWTITLHMRGPKVIDLDADSSRIITASSATTQTWTAGSYQYSLRATNAVGSSIEIDRGDIVVQADFLAIPEGADLRSQNEIALDAIEAVIAKRATKDQQRYTINNRELWRTPMADLLKLRQFYALQVGRERRRRKGCGTFGKSIPVRFKS